jgi:hypothetical protein
MLARKRRACKRGATRFAASIEDDHCSFRAIQPLEPKVGPVSRYANGV